MLGTIYLNIMMNDRGHILAEQIEQYHRLIRNSFETDFRIFFRICIYRIGIMVIMIACIRLMDNYYIFYPVLILAGISFGYTFSLLSACYGLKGILCMGAYLFPHYFIYIPLISVILRETSSQMYKAYEGDFRRQVVIFAIIMVGCGAESFINPFFLKIFLKNFL